MKSLILTSLLSLPLLTGCIIISENTNRGPHVEQERAVESFHSLHVAGVANVVFVQGDECSVRIEGDSSRVSHLQTRVAEQTLIVDSDHNEENSGEATVYVTASGLQDIRHQGVGQLLLSGGVSSAEDIVISIGGVGSVTIDSLTCRNLLMKHDGVGSTMMHVDCQTLRFTSSGVGASSIEVNADTVVVGSSGVGHVSLSGTARASYEVSASPIVSKVDDSHLKKPVTD